MITHSKRIMEMCDEILLIKNKNIKTSNKKDI